MPRKKSKINPAVKDKLILSLYDLTENWARPWAEAGYPVQCWDYKIEGCLLRWFGGLIDDIRNSGLELYGVLAAPPCTDFAGSGARWWKDKDNTPFEDDDGNVWMSTTEKSQFLVMAVVEIIELFKPAFWSLEQPVGRLEKFFPELKSYRRMSFNPCDYGDPYTKKTILYGNFNTNLPKNPVEPVMVEMNGKRGSIFWALPPSKDRAALRSATPLGFARAFFEANRLKETDQLKLFAA